MNEKREMLTKSERNLLEANIKLSNDKNEMLKDILNLIKCIKENNYTNEEIEEVIKYYSNLQIKGKEYKRL